MATPITDEELSRAVPSATPVAPPPLPSVITDDELSRATPSQAGGPGMLESFGRGALSGAAFGFEDEIGLADRARQDASRQTNPWAHFAGELVGGIAPMVGAAFLPGGQVAAGARAAGLVSRGAGLLRSALVPGEIGTVRQALGQGAKLGATYGALSGAGHADPSPSASLPQALGQRAMGAVTGGTLGAGFGAGVGAAGYGVSRLIGAALNRTMPSLREVAEAASNPQLQGINDVLRQAGYDRYTPADFAALRDRLRDPTQRHLYEGLNIIEALEMRPVQPMPVTGELRPPVAVSPNLRDWAQDAANTGGAGRQEAVQSFAERRAEMPGMIAGDVERTFGQPLGPRAAEADAIPGLIDATFGSGSADAVAAAQAAQRSALGKAYDRLRESPLTVNSPLDYRSFPPVFRQALQYATDAEVLRGFANPPKVPRAPRVDIGTALREAVDGPPRPVGPTLPGAAPGETQPFSTLLARNPEGRLQVLTPANILDIHHALVMAARPKVGGDLATERMAGQLKRLFSDWADRALRGHEALRTDYARFQRTLEAQDLAGQLPINRGGADHAALRFVRASVGRREEAGRKLEDAIRRYDASMARYQSGAIKTPPKRSVLTEHIGEIEVEDDILGAFRRSWGESVKAELARTGDPNTIVRPALTPAGRQRIVDILGPEEGGRFLNGLLTYEARNQGMALGLRAGGSDNAALQFFDRAVREGRTEVVETFRRAWGDRIREELARAASPAEVNSIVNSLLSREGKNRILRILGPDTGREFIESLYNKQMQAGLSQTLFGGPDTAYKLARNRKADALMDAVHGVFHLRPMQVLRSTGEIMSAAYKQRRADQGNRLLSVQGPEQVAGVVDAVLARDRLRRTAHPFVLNPALMALRPFLGASVASLAPFRSRDDGRGRPPMLPYRP